jgi:hypothetical protein
MSATATHLLLHIKWAHDVVRPLASNVSPLIPGTKAPKFLMISEGNSMSLDKHNLVIIGQ